MSEMLRYESPVPFQRVHINDFMTTLEEMGCKPMLYEKPQSRRSLLGQEASGNIVWDSSILGGSARSKEGVVDAMVDKDGYLIRMPTFYCDAYRRKQEYRTLVDEVMEQLESGTISETFVDLPAGISLPEAEQIIKAFGGQEVQVVEKAPQRSNGLLEKLSERSQRRAESRYADLNLEDSSTSVPQTVELPQIESPRIRRERKGKTTLDVPGRAFLLGEPVTVERESKTLGRKLKREVPAIARLRRGPKGNVQVVLPEPVKGTYAEAVINLTRMSQGYLAYKTQALQAQPGTRPDCRIEVDQNTGRIIQIEIDWARPPRKKPEVTLSSQPLKSDTLNLVDHRLPSPGERVEEVITPGNRSRENNLTFPTGDNEAGQISLSDKRQQGGEVYSFARTRSKTPVIPSEVEESHTISSPKPDISSEPTFLSQTLAETQHGQADQTLDSKPATNYEAILAPEQLRLDPEQLFRRLTTQARKKHAVVFALE